MRKIYLLLCVLAVIATACVSESTVTEAQGRFLNPTASTNVTPMAADLQVSSQRITYEADYIKDDDSSISSEKAKQYTIAAAITKYKADVLVAPLLQVQETDSKIHVTVCGYPATYKNFRKATLQDYEMERAMSRSGKRR